MPVQKQSVNLFNAPRMCVIFSDRCCVVHRPFVRMVIFKFLADFLVDHLAFSVVSSLVLFLR